MSSPSMSQKFTAEIIGTAILVFIGAGSVPLTVFLTGSNPFGSAELSTISFCFAFAIFAAVYAVGHISGAHIDPAVTIALLATRKIDSRTAGIYIVAQVIGAIVGALLTLRHPGRERPGEARPRCRHIQPRHEWRRDRPGGRDHRHRHPGLHCLRRRSGWPRPSRISPGSSSASSSTGSSSLSVRSPVPRLNPARQIGPELIQGLIGATTKWEQLPVYIVGPIVGGLIGAFLYEFTGHTRTTTVPGAAVAEPAHAEA